MVNALVAFSLRHRGAVVALACILGGYGLWVASRSRLDVFPEFAPPQVVVHTEAPGLSPEEVESVATRPVEAALNGLQDLDALRSQSIQGLSVVTATFRDGTDVLRARQAVGERLGEAAARLPQGVHPPAMAPQTSSTSVFLVVGLTSASRTSMEIRTFADWTLRPRLLGVPGVAKVVVYGGEVRQIQIQARPDRLAALGLSIDDLLRAAGDATGVRGAGFIEGENQRVVIRTEGQSLDAGSLGRVPVQLPGGARVRLADVARVVEAPEPKLGDATVMGTPGVTLVLCSQVGSNTLEVTEGAERALNDMCPAIGAAGLTLHADLFRPATFIDAAVGNVNRSLLLGGLLVAVVLLFFLWNLRSAAISIVAIPLSLLVAVAVLGRLGQTLNTLTLGGLAIAIGEVVDDAIIDVENILRRLRENRARPAPGPALQVVYEASIEVRGAVVYATFVVALVFLPVLMMSGIEGRLFAPLAMSYVLAVLASLVVALTLTPALSLLLLPGSAGASEPPIAVRLRRGYRRILEAFARHPRRVVGASAALCLASLAALPFFGGAFLPEFREGHFIVHMSLVPGTSIAESVRLGREVTAELRRNPHIRSVAQHVGRAEAGDDTLGSHYSEFHVALAPIENEEAAEAIQSEIRGALAKFPGACFAITPFLTERMEETVSGATAEVAIEIFGDDLDELDRAARRISEVVSRMPGAADVQVESPPGAPQVVARLRTDRLLVLGFRPVQVLDAVEAAFQGKVVAQAIEGSRVTDVAVVLEPSARRDPEAVGSLALRAADGSLVRLSEVADVFLSTGRYAIFHEGTRRRQAVTLNVRGRSLAEFVAEAKERVAKEVRLANGLYTVFAGTAEAQSRARRELLLHSAVAGAGVLLLLGVVFRRPRNLLLVLANLPFALVGGVLAVFACGGWLSVGSLVGFVTLFGISTRNSIMMVAHYDHLVSREGQAWGLETALRGASERLLPVLMTALVTALGLLPIAIGSGDPGREIEGPMAIVILGGLVTSTALNLLVLPTLALGFGRFEAAERES